MDQVRDEGGLHRCAVGNTGGKGSRADNVVRWLHFAATPTFMAMALLTVAFGRGATAMLCSASAGMPAMHGMALMYLLMALFHAGPWVTLASRHSGIDQDRVDR